MIEQTEQKQDLFKINVKYLLDICTNLKDLVAEARFNLNRNGLKITELEPANVCLIDISLNAPLFQELIESEEIKTYGLNADNLYKILKENKKEDVRVYSSGNKLVFEFSNGFKSELSLIEIEADKKEIPFMENKTEITLDSKKFKEIIKNCSNVSDSLTIEKKDDDVFFIAQGLNRTEINLNSDEIRIIGEDSKSKYSLEYLSKFIKSQISEYVTLKFSSDSPLITEYKLPNFKINFLLAPRVDSED